MWVAKPLLYFSVAYITILIFAYCFQRRLLYFPDRKSPSKMIIQSLGLRFFSSDGQSYRGFIGTEQITSPVGTVIVFHGNAGAAWNREHLGEVI